MTLTSYERETTFLSTITFLSGSTEIDPVDNMAYIKVYDPDNNLYISDSGVKDSTGVYHYYISTSSDSPLGIYQIDWYGNFFQDSIFGNMPKHEKECFILDNVVI